MEPAHPDRLVREPQGGIRRAQPLAWIARTLAPEVHETVERHADLAQVRAQQVPHEARLEVIASRGDRCVCGEDDPRAGDQPGLLQGHLPRGAQLADSLDRAQKAVALVEVKDSGRHVERTQRAHAADAEHDLLAQAPVWFGDIEAVGDPSQVRRVGLEVGVEQEERHATDLGAPHSDAHGARADWRFNLDVLELSHRQLAAPVLRVHLDLAAAGVDVLVPETLFVEKTDRDEWQPKVAGCLQVVAGQDAEPARVDGQAFGQAELQREVGDDERRLGVHEARLAVVVLAAGGACDVERGANVLALARAGHSRLAEPREQQDGVLPGRFPQLEIEGAKEIFDSGLPGPEQIVGEFF